MKTTSLSKALIALTVFASTFICSSCGNPEVPDDPKPEGPWVDQLMHYPAIEYDPELKLLDYKYYVKVSSKQQVEELYAEMTDLDNYIPSYPFNDNFQTMAIRTLRESLDNHWLAAVDSARVEQENQEIRKLLNTFPQTIELTWEYKGFQFKTIGILSVNTNLIVYEPVDLFQIRRNFRSVRAILPRTRSTVPEENAGLKYQTSYYTDYRHYSDYISAGITFTVYGQYVHLKNRTYKQVISSAVTENISNPNPNFYQTLIEYHKDPIIPGENGGTALAYACAIGLSAMV